MENQCERNVLRMDVEVHAILFGDWLYNRAETAIYGKHCYDRLFKINEFHSALYGDDDVVCFPLPEASSILLGLEHLGLQYCPGVVSWSLESYDGKGCEIVIFYEEVEMPSNEKIPVYIPYTHQEIFIRKRIERFFGATAKLLEREIIPNWE